MPEATPPPPKREAILRAALEAFAERGVQGVAVPDLIARAGVGTGTVYRYFPGKEALVNELFRRHKRDLGERLAAAFDGGSSPRVDFDEWWAALVRFAREEPDAFRFLEMQDHRPYLDEASVRLESEVLAPLVAGTRQLQRAGRLRRDLRAEVLITVMWGAYVQLFKAEQQGHLTLTAADVDAARDACWELIGYSTAAS